ncbi:MAG: glycosyltransferase family 25 [Satyrvirus sp.]|uniref:Glycosyltransferase family 25 n=1 Tax=Satyrvirus sp. TaxID=2487771 RepID=A0A3G5ACP9_9VIRU|nr:MAG: glycosyltransferase family 25 [Satyrvirus sp.]
MILDTFPKVLWINLDRNLDRKKYMEALLDSYKITHFRIRAIDGMRLSDPELETLCTKNLLLSRGENACTCSHIKALKYFLENMSDDKVIIFEDDVSFEFLSYISYDWSDLEKNLPENYDIIQLAINCDKYHVDYKLVKTNSDMRYFCSAAYLVTRNGATKLLDRYLPKKTQKIDLSNNPYPTADAMITSTGNTFSIPIFTYATNQPLLKSMLHPSHYGMHNKSKDQQLKQWIEISKEKKLI